jgi:Mg2+ and Co2+ transporter CorA
MLKADSAVLFGGICNLMFLLQRTIVCKVETTSCRLEKLICEVWALSRWQQCCGSLAATFAWWWLDLLNPHLQTIRYVDKPSLLHFHSTYKLLEVGEKSNLDDFGHGLVSCLGQLSPYLLVRGQQMVWNMLERLKKWAVFRAISVQWLRKRRKVVTSHF